MPLLYDFDMDAVGDILRLLARNLQKRSLEKGLSRENLSRLSGVPTATIEKLSKRSN